LPQLEILENKMTSSQEVRFEISTLCNYRCQLCVRHLIKRHKQIMDCEFFEDLLNKIKRECPSQFKYLTFSGMGEPLMDPRIKDKISFASYVSGMETILITNGSLLTPEAFEDLESAGLNTVRVSMHANNPPDYARMHGIREDDYYGVVENLETILKRKKAPNNGPRVTTVGLYFVLQHATPEDIEQIKNRWADTDFIEIWQPHNWGNALKERAIQQKQVNCQRVNAGPLQVQIDGTINACCFDSNGETTLGDLKTQSLKAIFSEDSIQRLIYRKICEDCDQRNAEKGGALIYSSKNLADRIERTSSAFVTLKKEEA
jgi:wyosine [tRNA(Phe)-imidazoG37] synthetase (radical SAM superfamily)